MKVNLAPEVFNHTAGIQMALSTPMSIYSERSEYIIPPLAETPTKEVPEPDMATLPGAIAPSLLAITRPEGELEKEETAAAPLEKHLSEDSTTSVPCGGLSPASGGLAAVPVPSPALSTLSRLSSSPSLRSKAQPLQFLNGPVRPSSLSNPPTTCSATDHAATQMTCLVVDDDRLTRLLMSRMLSRLGCTVQCAENGIVALEMLLGKADPTMEKDGIPLVDRSDPKDRFGIVFLDNQMPYLGGLQTVKRMRSLNRDDVSSPFLAGRHSTLADWNFLRS